MKDCRSEMPIRNKKGSLWYNWTSTLPFTQELARFTLHCYSTTTVKTAGLWLDNYKDTAKRRLDKSAGWRGLGGRGLQPTGQGCDWIILGSSTGVTGVAAPSFRAHELTVAQVSRCWVGVSGVGKNTADCVEHFKKIWNKMYFKKKRKENLQGRYVGSVESVSVC